MASGSIQGGKADFGVDIKTLQFRWPLGMPLVKSLGQGLWELRSTLPGRIARVFFIVHGTRLVLLHAFIKKNQQTPASELDTARKRRHDYFRQTKR
jgi:phage-related protein